MMRILRSRWILSILGLGAGVWAYQQMARKQAHSVSVQRSRAMWRRSARTGGTGRAVRTARATMRPTAFNMAAKAGRAMMDTTMRTVRAINRG
jgi:hypothetical protein